MSKATRTKGPPTVDEAVRAEWLRRVEAEYRSAALTQNLTLWLMQLGAPLEFVHAGLRVVRDELSHAQLSARIYAAAGGRSSPELERDTLALVRTGDQPLEWDVLRVVVDNYCLGETAAVRLFQRLYEHAEVAQARRVLERILRDEVRHRDFGWSLLEWLLTTPAAPGFRTLIDRELGPMLSRLRAVYGGAWADAPEPKRLVDDPPPAACGWGLMPISNYVAAIDETCRRDLAPRFAALGIHMPAF